MRDIRSMLAVAVCVALVGLTNSREVADCSRSYTLSQSTLELVSPGNFSGYPTNLDCTWIYRAASPTDVLLWKVFDVAVDCGDGINIYDGNSTSANPLQSNVCTAGSQFSLPLQTTSGQFLAIQFRTNGESLAIEKGFFTSVITARDQSLCPVSGSKVNLTATSEQQIITSPNFPNTYSTNYRCEWMITASDSGKTVKVKFLFIDIDTDSTGRCFDSVSFYESGNKIKEVCGNEIFSPAKSTEVESTGSQIQIVFSTDDLQNERGFKLSFQQVESLTTIKPKKTTTTERTTTSESTTTTPTTTTVTTRRTTTLPPTTRPTLPPTTRPTLPPTTPPTLPPTAPPTLPPTTPPTLPPTAPPTLPPTTTTVPDLCHISLGNNLKAGCTRTVKTIRGWPATECWVLLDDYYWIWYKTWYFKCHRPGCAECPLYNNIDENRLIQFFFSWGHWRFQWKF